LAKSSAQACCQKNSVACLLAHDCYLMANAFGLVLWHLQIT
jgi:hypothetical protein